MSTDRVKLVLQNISHQWFLSLFDVDIFCINVSVNILIWMDILQNIQLWKERNDLCLERGISFRSCTKPKNFTDNMRTLTILQASCRTSFSDRNSSSSSITDWRDRPMTGKIRNLLKQRTTCFTTCSPHWSKMFLYNVLIFTEFSYL